MQETREKNHGDIIEMYKKELLRIKKMSDEKKDKTSPQKDINTVQPHIPMENFEVLPKAQIPVRTEMADEDTVLINDFDQDFKAQAPNVPEAVKEESVLIDDYDPDFAAQVPDMPEIIEKEPVSVNDFEPDFTAQFPAMPEVIKQEPVLFDESSNNIYFDNTTRAGIMKDSSDRPIENSDNAMPYGYNPGPVNYTPNYFESMPYPEDNPYMPGMYTEGMMDQSHIAGNGGYVLPDESRQPIIPMATELFFDRVAFELKTSYRDIQGRVLELFEKASPEFAYKIREHLRRFM